MARDTDVDIALQRKRQLREDRALANLAERQFGVVSRDQLKELGFGRGAIDHRLRLGRLHALHRGVYAVGQTRLRAEARWMAAVLASGRGAALSHLPAGALWGIAADRGQCHVTVPRGIRHRTGIRVHHACLAPDEVTIHRGIPVTTVPRTLFDLASQISERQLERAINEAELRRLWDELTLDRLLRRYPGHPGNKNVRASLHKRRQGDTVTRSELEEDFVAFVDEGGLPRPEINAWIEGFEVDAVWRSARLVVELDGRSTHGTAAAFERDRERDRVLTTAGWRPIRVTARQLGAGRRGLVADLRRLLADTV